MNDANTERLHEILTYRRGNNSLGEIQFIREVLLRDYKLTRMVSPVMPQNTYAFVYDVADANGVVPPILFSCHIDTVHSDQIKGVPVAMQEPVFDEGLDLYFKDDGDPLGADDGAGMWLLMEMIDNNVPGSYIFHRGEECGGVGSTGMKTHHKEWLSRFKWALAFDRRGSGDVITEMFSGRVCSDAFAKDLSAKLNDYGFTYAPDDTGSFTDTANYRGIIPECCNVSIGYDDEHSGSETLDLRHLFALRYAMITIFEKGDVVLPTVRDPNAQDYGNRYTMYYGNGYGRGSSVTATPRKSRRERRRERKAQEKILQGVVTNISEARKVPPMDGVGLPVLGTANDEENEDDVRVRGIADEDAIIHIPEADIPVDYTDWRNVPSGSEGVKDMSYYEVLRLVTRANFGDTADLIQNMCNEIEEMSDELEDTIYEYSLLEGELSDAEEEKAELMQEIQILEGRNAELKAQLHLWETGQREELK